MLCKKQGRIQKYGLGGREGVGSRPLSPLPFGPSRPLPSPTAPALPFPSPPLPLEVGPLIQLEGLGERCKLPQGLPRGLGRSPSWNWIWYILALKSDIYSGNNFSDFPESELTKFQTFMPGNLH